MKLYVIVRKDLTPSQRAVQAGHALAAYMLRGSFLRRWENETLIYLGVKGLKQLEKLKHNFKYDGIDLDNETTAIATDINNRFVERLNLL